MRRAWLRARKPSPVRRTWLIGSALTFGAASTGAFGSWSTTCTVPVTSMVLPSITPW